MIFDTSIVLKNYDGKDIHKASTDTKGVAIAIPLTLRDTFIDALNNALPEEILTAEQKTKIYGLSVKLYNDKEVNLTSDDIVFLKERVGKMWNPVVFGRVCEIFAEIEKN